MYGKNASFFLILGLRNGFNQYGLVTYPGFLQYQAGRIKIYGKQIVIDKDGTVYLCRAWEPFLGIYTIL